MIEHGSLGFRERGKEFVNRICEDEWKLGCKWVKAVDINIKNKVIILLLAVDFWIN